MMLSVAVEMEARRLENQHGAMATAVGALFDVEISKKYTQGTQNIIQQVRETQAKARGVKLKARPKIKGTSVADQFVAMMGKLGT